MLLVFKYLNKLLKLLNSETAPSQLAAGLCFGALVGFSPFWSLHNLVLFLLVCLLRVNFSMFFLGFGVFSLLAFSLDPVFDSFGYWLLVDFSAARSLWLFFASTPVLPFFRFNNTIVVGSLVSGLLIFIPLFAWAVWAIKKYRNRWREQILSSKSFKAIKATKIYAWYEKFAAAREKWERLS